MPRVVQRARAVEPVHLIGGASRLPTMFPVPGLALASTAHVYPEIVNGQAVIGVADRVVDGHPGAAAGSRSGRRRERARRRHAAAEHARLCARRGVR